MVSFLLGFLVSLACSIGNLIRYVLSSSAPKRTVFRQLRVVGMAVAAIAVLSMLATSAMANHGFIANARLNAQIRQENRQDARLERQLDRQNAQLQRQLDRNFHHGHHRQDVFFVPSRTVFVEPAPSAVYYAPARAPVYYAPAAPACHYGGEVIQQETIRTYSIR